MNRTLVSFLLCLGLVAGAQDKAPLQPLPTTPLKQGVFLYANPDLRDPNFYQTVVLLINYEKEGAMGLIINEPTEISLEEALPEVEGIQKDSFHVYFGGPVSRNRMLVLLRSDKSHQDVLKVFKDVYYTGNKDLLTEMLKKRGFQKKVRVYAGHAGWAPGQLEHEVSRGDWIISYADADMIFSENPDKIWPEVYKIQEQIEIRNPPLPQPSHPLKSGNHPKA